MIYNCFTSNNNPQFNAIGNPSFVYFYGRDIAENKLSKIAEQANTPISCFVRLNENLKSAYVSFFAPNGKNEGFCGHGLISVVRALKDSGLGYIKYLNTESGISIRGEVIKDNLSVLYIPTKGFDIFKFTDQTTIYKIKEIFNLDSDVVEVFKAGKLGDLLVELKSSESLQNLRFDVKSVKDLLKSLNLRIVSFFSKGSNFKDVDTEIRVFYVNLDNLEDIACGSINISIAKILNLKYNIINYKAIQPFSYSETGIIGGYQEIEYDLKNEILTLKGFTTPAKYGVFIKVSEKKI